MNRGIVRSLAYDDVRVNSGNISRPGGSDPAWTTYSPGGANTYLMEFSKGNYGTFTVQIPHTYKIGEDILAHAHWTGGGSTETAVTVGWALQYSWANMDGVFPSMTTADLKDVLTTVSHTHQRTPDIVIDGHTTPMNISSMLICNIIRQNSTADTWVTTAAHKVPMLLEVDFHIPVDSLGSHEWDVK